MKHKRTILIIILFAVMGCSPAVRSELKEAVEEDISLAAVFKDPDANRGKEVVLSGVIAGSVNTKDGTLLEVIERPTDPFGRARETRKSLGRFMVLHEGYLETLIYAKGRVITVRGEITGGKEGTEGGIKYVYPVLKSLDIRIFKTYETPPHVQTGIGFGIGSSC